MKLFFNSCLAMLFIAVLSISNSLAQGGQVIPFQGTLYQNGTAVNGTVNITFTIADPAWTESHDNVSVTQGVYAVVLGETTPFPDDMFTTGTTPDLVVNIGGNDVATVALHAPFISEAIVGQNMPGQLERTFDEDGTEFNGLTMVVDGVGNAQTSAFEGVAQSTTQNTGVEGFAVSGIGNVDTQNGLYGQAAGDGTGNHRGVMGYGAGAGKYNHGLKGYAAGDGNGDTGQNYGEGSINFGVEGNATGNAYNNTGVEGSNFGTEGVWNFGVHGISNAGTGTTVENHGVAGKAFGPGINYGIHGIANGGAENYAGYFDGDVNINGALMLNGSPFNPLTSLPDTLNAVNEATTTGRHSAVEGISKTTGWNSGVEGYAESLSGNLEHQTGVYGVATGTGEGKHRGVVGVSQGAGKYNHGIFGNATGAGNGDTGKGYGEGSINFGVEGSSSGNAWNNTGVEGSNYGIEGVWNFGLHGISNAGTGTEVENHGVAGKAFGPGINYGVHGTAAGGDQNYAGFFEGDVQVQGPNAPNLKMGGRNTVNDDLANLSMFGRTEDGTGGYLDNVNAWVSSNDTEDWGNIAFKKTDIAGNSSVQTFSINGFSGHATSIGNYRTFNDNSANVGWFGRYNNDGFVQLVSYNDAEEVTGAALIGSFADGENPEFYIEGTKQEYLGLGRFRVEQVGSEEAGRLELNTSNNGASFSVGIVNNDTGNDTGGYSSELFMNGTNTPNIQMGGQSWENNDLANFQMYGRTPSGDGWWHSNVNMSVGSDGTDDWGGLSITRSNIAGNTNTETFNIDGQNGNINAQGNIWTPRAEMISNWGNTGNQGAFLMRDADDSQQVQLSVDDDGSGNYWGQLALGTNQGNDSYMNISSGGINMGNNSYDNGIVMNYDNSGGPVFEMYSGSNLQAFINGSNGDATFARNLNVGNSSATLGSVWWAGNGGPERGVLYLDGTEDAGISDKGRATLEVRNDGAGSYGHLLLRNYVDAGGGSPTHTVELNGENGDGAFQGEVFANSLNSGGVAYLGNADDGNGTYGNMNLYSPAGPDNRISMGFADTGSNAGFMSLWYNSGGGSDEYGLMNVATGGPGGAVYGGLSLKDDLGNSVSINGYGDISASGEVSASVLRSSDGMVQSSDARFKKNVKSIDNALAKTQQLNGYTYNWNKLAKRQKGIDNKEEQVGVLAQELEAVFPQLVKTDEDGYKAVNYAALTAVLIEAVKELSEQVSTLQGENAELKAELTKVDELEIKIDLIQKLLAKQTIAASQATVSR
ncbi:MAG: tail fiber domain-containing protein [Reichenbachiella sp.]|uniref:tail fiber domain-containing protein n=1 Tax=Reichenbachiella sp. TaxID=2184521 RepID=UPI00329A01F1